VACVRAGSDERRTTTRAAVAGLAVGVPSGLVGLGGAELRLPLLLAVFGFAALAAVVVNKVMSLVVVLAAIPARLGGVPLDDLTPHLPAVAALLAGSLVAAWVAAGWAARLEERRLRTVLAVLLALVAAVFVLERSGALPGADLAGDEPAGFAVGVLTGLAIGAVAAVLGVAGGELLVPTFVLLFGTGAAVAGSLSLLVSLPTMVVALTRYARAQVLGVVAEHRGFLLAMALGSVVGAAVGGLLVAVVPEGVAVALLTVLLVASAISVGRGRHASPRATMEA